MSRKSKRKDIDRDESAVTTFLLKFGSKLLLGLIIILAVLTLTQCTVKKPESPTWSTQFVVPVVNRTYDMQELVDRMDQEGLTIDDSGDVIFSITEDLDTVGLDQDDFSTDDLSYRFSQQLGPIDIEKPTIDPLTVDLASLSGLAIVAPGDSAFVPDTTFEVRSEMPTVVEFSTATVSQGRADVVIVNELDLTLDNIVIELLDSSNDALITSGTYPNLLPSGDTAVVPLVLDGETVPNQMTVLGRYHTPTDTVRDFSTRYIETRLDFSDTLWATSAVARVPALSRTDSSVVTLAESDRIDSATIETGTLTVDILNNTALEATVTITAPDFVSGGLPLTSAQSIPAGSSVQMNLNVSGYRMVPRSSAVPQEVAIVAVAEMPGSGTQQVPIDQADSFAVSADLAGVRFSSVTGQFQTVSATFESVSTEIDIPTGLENVELTSAMITLEVENAIDLPGTIDIQLSGNNGKNSVFQGDIAPAGLAASATSSIVNDSVASFLSPLPSFIEASGTVSFGDGSYEGTITRDDFVFAKVHLYTPLEMIINPSAVETDIEREEIDQNDIDAITDHFIEGRFVYRLSNHLPLGAHVNIFLGPDSASLFTAPQVRFDSLYITAAPVDASGLVTDTEQTPYQEIHLDSIDIKVLENPVLYVGQQLLLDGSDGQVVRMTASDYITVTGRIEVEYLFDGEF